jgi:hypothetical protein
VSPLFETLAVLGRAVCLEPIRKAEEAFNRWAEMNLPCKAP